MFSESLLLNKMILEYVKENNIEEALAMFNEKYAAAIQEVLELMKDIGELAEKFLFKSVIIILIKSHVF